MKTYILNNARFTVISDSIIRMEYAVGAKFLDDATMFACRDYEGIMCDAKISSGSITLDTGVIKITYTDNGRWFNRDNLYGVLNIDGRCTAWAYGENSGRNLGGTLSTLDGCDGEKPLPDGILSRDGWYVVDDSKKPVLKDGWIQSREYEHKADIYLFVYGTDYKKALKSFAYVSGKVPLPRKYVLGSWYSRWWTYTADELIGIVDDYDRHNFPLDILVIDMDWHYNDWNIPKEHPNRASYGFGHAGNLGWTGYTWNRERIPDPDHLLSELNKRGIVVTLNDHPADGVRSNEDCYPEFARALGLDAEKGENIRFDPGNKKYMKAFFECAHVPIENQGIGFWWVDWQQNHLIPEIKGVPGQKVLPWLNHLYFEHSKRDGKRGMSFDRWGGLGDHKHPIYFSGDIACLWDALAFEVAMTVSAGNVLCFFWSHDIGGFFGERNGEMFTRWVQFGITSAALRLHSEGSERLDRRPWKWDDKYCDAIRKMFHLRSRLIPYLYSSVYKSCTDSIPLLRPMYIEYPEFEESYHNRGQYLLGDAFLCAPVTEPGSGDDFAVKKKVWLPEGVWYNFFDGRKIDGGRYITEECPLDEFPMYVKAGVPVPMQPVSLRMTSTPTEELHVRIYSGNETCSGTFCLYEDDGISDGGESLKTEITFDKENGVIIVTMTPEGEVYDGLPDKRNVIIELYDTDNVMSDDAIVCYDADNRIALIEAKDVSPFDNLKFRLEIKQ